MQNELAGKPVALIIAVCEGSRAIGIEVFADLFQRVIRAMSLLRSGKSMPYTHGSCAAAAYEHVHCPGAAP